MKINIQIKFDPFTDERHKEYALVEAERKMAEEIYKALQPYIKREINQEHVRLTLDGIEKEELGFDISKYETRIHKYLKINEPDDE